MYKINPRLAKIHIYTQTSIIICLGQDVPSKERSHNVDEIASWRAIGQYLLPLVITTPLPNFCVSQDRLGYFVVKERQKVS